MNQNESIDASSNPLAPNGKPRVDVELIGRDGNAMAIIGRCEKAMRRAGWSQEEISAFRTEATSGDYDHVLQTVMNYAEDAS